LFAALTLKAASTKKARALRPGAGMPAYAPTAKERKIVEKAAGFGLPHDKICQLIVSERTGKPIGLYTTRFTATTPRGGDAIYPAPAQSIPATRYRRICRCRRFVKEITRRGLARQYNLTPSHSLVEPDHGPFNR